MSKPRPPAGAAARAVRRDTRGTLVQAAQSLFAEHGYAAVGTEEIVRRAGVTRGSMYHHFRDKAELFTAVLERVEADLVDEIERRVAESDDPRLRLQAALGAFLDACGDTGFRRIALLDAPSVLGWRRLRAVDDRFGLGYVKHALADAMDAGSIDRVPVEALAHVLVGATLEGAMLIGRSSNPERTRRAVEDTINRLLEGLRRR